MTRFLGRINCEFVLRQLLFLCLATDGYLLGFQFAGASCTVDECKEITDVARRSFDGTTWVFKTQWSPETSTFYKMRSTSGLGGTPQQHQTEMSTMMECDVYTAQCSSPWEADRFYKGTCSNCTTAQAYSRLFCMDPQTKEGVANSWNEYQDSSH